MTDPRILAAAKEIDPEVQWIEDRPCWDWPAHIARRNRALRIATRIHALYTTLTDEAVERAASVYDAALIEGECEDRWEPANGIVPELYAMRAALLAFLNPEEEDR